MRDSALPTSIGWHLGPTCVLAPLAALIVHELEFYNTIRQSPDVRRSKVMEFRSLPCLSFQLNRLAIAITAHRERANIGNSQPYSIASAAGAALHATTSIVPIIPLSS